MTKSFLLLTLVMSLMGRALSGEPEIQTEKAVRKTKTYNLSTDKMWRKWTTHEGLRTFFGEENMMELKIGGPFEIYFNKDAPAGSKGSEGCTVISYLPREMLSFSWNAPPSFPTIRNGEYKTWVVVTFAPMKGGKTEVRLTHLGWRDGEEWDKVYDYFDSAWGTVFEWLEKSCEQEAKS